MEDNQNKDDMELSTKVADRSQVIFNMMEYLQDIRKENAIGEDNLESLDVAIQCLSTAFNLDITNAELTKKYSIKPQTLPHIIGVGLSGKEKISSLVEQLKKQKMDPNDLEVKYSQYVQSIRKKGFFGDFKPGSSEYEERMQRARRKFLEKFGTPEHPSQAQTKNDMPKQTTTDAMQVDSMSKEEKIKLAEQHKVDGNNFLQAKQHIKAIESYTKAIELDDSNAIYYCNRAAVYSHLGRHEEAISDCKRSISLKPDYGKAYGRLGLAYFSTGNYKEAVEQYRKAVQYEPTNASFKDNLLASEKKLMETQQPPQQPTTTNATPNTSTPPNLSQFMNMFGGGGVPPVPQTGDANVQAPRAPGLGGLNLAEMLNNPMMQNMASQMMNNPQMMNMAQNLMANPSALNNMLRTFGLDPSALNGLEEEIQSQQNQNQNQNPPNQ